MIKKTDATSTHPPKDTRSIEARKPRFDWLLSGFKWYRKWTQDKWELWWVEGVYSDIWHRVDEWSDVTGGRPTAACRGTPTKEDWGGNHERHNTAS